MNGLAFHRSSAALIRTVLGEVSLRPVKPARNYPSPESVNLPA
jgi:hypothetical protein